MLLCVDMSHKILLNTLKFELVLRENVEKFKRYECLHMALDEGPNCGLFVNNVKQIHACKMRNNLRKSTKHDV